MCLSGIVDSVNKRTISEKKTAKTAKVAKGSPRDLVHHLMHKYLNNLYPFFYFFFLDLFSSPRHLLELLIIMMMMMMMTMIITIMMNA